MIDGMATDPETSPEPMDDASLATTPEPGRTTGRTAGRTPGDGRRRRPFGLIVLASLMLLKAALVLLVTVGLAMNPSALIKAVGGTGFLTDEAGLVGTAVIAMIAVLLVASATGLLFRRRAGWLVAMILTGAFIAIDISSFFLGSPNHFWMALNIITVFYLNQPDVRAVFDIDDPMVRARPDKTVAG